MTEATNLESKRAQLDQKLASLRMVPDVADLVRKADNTIAEHRAAANALESQIATIDAELGLRERDRRAAAQQQRQDERQAQIKALLDEAEVRLTAISDGEAATHALVDAIQRTLASNARAATLVQKLSTTGKVPASALSASELVLRLAGRIASIMGTLKGHEYRFGSLSWPSGARGLFPPDRSWREDEEKRMAAALEPLLVDNKEKA